jgi:hypothetical protein
VLKYGVLLRNHTHSGNPEHRRRRVRSGRAQLALYKSDLGLHPLSTPPEDGVYVLVSARPHHRSQLESDLHCDQVGNLLPKPYGSKRCKLRDGYYALGVTTPERVLVAESKLIPTHLPQR